MRLNLTLLARIYCAFAAATLIVLGLQAWSAGRDNLYLGAMLCGVGLFMVAGLFGSATRVLAMLGLSVVYLLLSFVFSLGLLVLNSEAPSGGMFIVWTVELLAAGLAALLARSLYRTMLSR